MIAPINTVNSLPIQATPTLQTQSIQSVSQSTNSISTQSVTQEGFTDVGLAFLALLALTKNDDENKLELYQKAALLAIALNLATSNQYTEISSASQISTSESFNATLLNNSYNAGGSNISFSPKGMLYNSSI